MFSITVCHVTHCFHVNEHKLFRVCGVEVIELPYLGEESLTMAHSYETYYNWSTTVPQWLCFAGVIVSIFLMPLLYCISRRTKTSKHLIHLLYYYSKIIFRETLRKERTDSETKIYLHQYELKSEFDIVIFSTVTTVAACYIFIAFWASFLTHETFVCSSSLDCFVTNSSLDDADSSDFSPIKDCTDVESNATVVCFEFVFDLSGGLASAVGFLAVTVVYVYVLGFLLAFVSETNSRLLFGIASLVWAFFSWCIGIIFIILILNVPLFRTIAFKTPENTLKWFSYVTGFTYIGIFTNPVILEFFKKIFCVNRCNSERSTKNELSDSTPLHPHT